MERREPREGGKKETRCNFSLLPFYEFWNYPDGTAPGYAVMQKLSQARSELRAAAAASDKGIQKLQFLKVPRGRGGHGRGAGGWTAATCLFHGSLCASLHAPTVKDSGNATARRGWDRAVRGYGSLLFSYSNIDPDTTLTLSRMCQPGVHRETSRGSRWKIATRNLGSRGRLVIRDTTPEWSFFHFGTLGVLAWYSGV